MHELKSAHAAACHLVRLLRPACERIAIAGSIRRRKPQVKDLEIVAIPRTRIVEEPDGLFDRRIVEHNLLEERLCELIDCDQLLHRHPDLEWTDSTGQAKRRHAPGGPRFKKLLWCCFPVDLFIVCPATWGALYTLRTGGADFSRLLVTQQWDGGAMPSHLREHAGRLVDQGTGKILDTPEERDFFTALDLPFIRPRDRSAATLQELFRERSRHAGVVSQNQ